MQVTIHHQILVGNLFEGLKLDDFLAALDEEWTATVLKKYPDAEVTIDRDIQRASGCTRELSVEVGDDGDDDDLQQWLVHDEEKLAEQERFYA